MSENLLLVIGACACHRWILSGSDKIGRCRGCGERPIVEGLAPDGAVTECLHSGPCRTYVDLES